MPSRKSSSEHAQGADDRGVTEAGFALDLVIQLVQLREQRGLSQAALAKRVETHQQAISRLEDPLYGRHSLRTLREVAASLDAYVDVVLVPSERMGAYLDCRYQPVLRGDPPTKSPSDADSDSDWPRPAHRVAQVAHRSKGTGSKRRLWHAYGAVPTFSLGRFDKQVATVGASKSNVGTFGTLNISKEQTVPA